MSTNQLILRNFKKNIKNYYLYIFALVFSVALYFAFVTLQYDPGMEEAKSSIKGAAGLRAASVLLIAIVSVFLLYANKIFMKRRSKEIGLFQLIGMTKTQVFRMLSLENLLLYFSSLFVGTFCGFASSKLVMMVLYRLMGINKIAELSFSPQAFVQTLIVFTAIYLLILLTNYLFIKKQTILSLFKVVSTTEGRVKKLSLLEMMIGIAGIAFIIAGYYISSKLFSGDFVSMKSLAMAMILILALVIIGTYLFYKGSVSFLGNLVRKKKDGHLNINEVLSLSSIMFRMKSNSMLLTIITTVSALAIGLLSLSYISFYSAEKSGKNYVPNDYSFTNEKQAAQFTQELDDNGISYHKRRVENIAVPVNMSGISENGKQDLPKEMPSPKAAVISDQSVNGVDLSPNEAMFTGYSDILRKLLPLKDSGQIGLKTKTGKILTQKSIGISDEYIISYHFTGGGVTLIVDATVFEQLKKDFDPEIQPQKDTIIYTGIDIKNEADKKKAHKLFKQVPFSGNGITEAQSDYIQGQKSTMGLAMFIVGFLGLAFLITSGCILYFKQMDESEEEKANYTILRKIGYTQGDLLKGIQLKQLFNFGIPLIIGLIHGYFAVQSGWFLFGSELWTPMMLVMVIYTALYSIFAALSVLYYKKVIKQAL
ncbi:ABC transporter permease [Bacillus xiapuensis]|uniref:ABC transporter permease n=1 Tax=Bacillus xiapuensis TaxID=2014075 RepID=UPI000C2303E8|nr:ABC transporter permease [Bacillus xiapuensis]